MDDMFIKYPKYKRLYECFIELADTDIQKDEIDKIMRYGEYNGFKLNSMLSNKRHSEKLEIERRITFAEIILFDEKLFLYLANNGLNVFHGTRIDALNSILSEGILSSAKISKEGIQLKTGEESAWNKSSNKQIEKRRFISLTDDFVISALYAGFPYEEQTEYLKKHYEKELIVKYIKEDDIPIIICFNGNDIEQNYSESLIDVESIYTEIGVNASINPLDIRCIITSYDKIEYAKSLVSPYGIDVLGYDLNYKFEKRVINDKKGKFYSILFSGIDIDEKEFERCKEDLKRTLKELKMNGNIKINSSSLDSALNKENLSEDMSLIIASEIKMDLVFDLTEQYNSVGFYIPITESNLISKYNINANVAKQLASEVNTMIEDYVKEKTFKHR